MALDSQLDDLEAIKKLLDSNAGDPSGAVRQLVNMVRTPFDRLHASIATPDIKEVLRNQKTFAAVLKELLRLPDFGSFESKRVLLNAELSVIIGKE